MYLGHLRNDKTSGTYRLSCVSVNAGTSLEALEDLKEELSDSRVWVEKLTIPIAQLRWKVLVVQDKSLSSSDLVFVMVGSIVLLVASICLALWLRAVRHQQMVDLVHASERERNALMVRNADEAARAASNLNEILAHEVSCL